MVAQQRTAEADPSRELAARLRMLQELSGRGVRALARDTGLSSSSLSRYLTGRTVPPWPAVVALCRLVTRDPRPLRPLWERASHPLPAPPRTSRQIHPPTPPASAPRPPRNDLPRDAPDFTGRRAELAAVLAAVAGSRVVALDGMAGVGKTCLAVHAAHRLAADHADAQLYLDLHGFTDGRRPLDPDPALRALLAALDVPSERIPQEGGVERLAACWRGPSWPTGGPSSSWTTPPTPTRSARCCPARATPSPWSPAATGCSAWRRCRRSRWTC
ncbi:helix-turn-helix domain-containing protein [Actinacidiphila glaucinigra]|uniref:helix-turn-helix domain-containing protein n=1 Tax=Actinacidiphila glaucinigra TaxID=235986 RepID=UPI0036B09088